MNHVLRFLFFTLIVRPAVLIVLGLNVRHRERMPSFRAGDPGRQSQQPLGYHGVDDAVSHSDACQTASRCCAGLFLSLSALEMVCTAHGGDHPTGPESTQTGGEGPTAPISEALERGEIVILFPEGGRRRPRSDLVISRRESHTWPANMKRCRSIRSTCMAWAKHSLVAKGCLIPFFVDVFIGDPMTWTGDKKEFVELLSSRLKDLANEGRFAEWS